MRKLRHIPPGGALVEVTTRTLEGRFLLRPSQTLNQITQGVLARAQEQTNICIHGYVFMSGHYHLLVSPEDALQLSNFMRLLNSNLAREVGELHDWKTIVWAHRYHGIIVSDEPVAQEKRLRYLLSHGAKENLVASPREWPGLHLAKHLVDGEPPTGAWINRTAMHAAKQRTGKEQDPKAFTTKHEVRLEPIPYLNHLTPKEYRAHIAEMVTEIEEEHRKRRTQGSVRVMGAKQVCRLHPHTRPKRLEHSPAPAFHTATAKVFKILREAYALFLEAYRDAADRLRAGDLEVQFPAGSFPPALPFVPP